MESLQIVTIFFNFAKVDIIDNINTIAGIHFHYFNTHKTKKRFCMAKEIERKFLVTNTSFISKAESSTNIRQAYISTNPDSTVRLRIKDSQAYMTVKGRNNGAERDEWEFSIPYSDACEMARKLCGGFSIDKTRYIVDHEGWKWEIDVFHGRHEGLIVAEIELPSAECQPPLPKFIGIEVTGDARYYNSMLSLNAGIPV